MAKIKSQYVCQTCSYAAPKWLGKCPDCGAWNSFAEETTSPRAFSQKSGTAISGVPSSTLVLDDSTSNVEASRISLPFSEFSRVLGGGLVKGSVVLLGGEPGIGKSTLLLQLLGTLKNRPDETHLYISGEESAHQIQLRAKRLGIQSSSVHLLCETNLANILATLESQKPTVCVLDSVQTVYWPELESIPGSISQVREVADRLIRCCKTNNIALFLVGHVNKDGNIAGPKTLEHLVDTVLQFEGDKDLLYRMVRSSKNRFGPTDEIAVFQMVDHGLREIENPSEIFIQDRPRNTPGSVIFPLLEGSRTVLVEIQGLATKTAYGLPIRNAVGFDKNRLTMLLAVLEKRGHMDVSHQDVYVNIVGGIKVQEPAADLAVLASVVSSLTNHSLPDSSVILGEVGLAGEIRSVSSYALRLKECEKLNFKKILGPKPKSPPYAGKGLEFFECPTVETLVQRMRRS